MQNLVCDICKCIVDKISAAPNRKIICVSCAFKVQAQNNDKPKVVEVDEKVSVETDKESEQRKIETEENEPSSETEENKKTKKIDSNSTGTDKGFIPAKSGKLGLFSRKRR